MVRIIQFFNHLTKKTKMNEFLNWAELDLRKSSGEERLKCPACSGTRKNKTDKSLTVNHESGLGFCHHCEIKVNRNFEDKKYEVKFTLPKQDWKNHTNLSDKMVKWVKETRNIGQQTLMDLGITEEIHYQPADGKERNNIVFNYFEGGVVVNKKYRTPEKHFTQSKDGKSIFYNINSTEGAEKVFIVEGEFDVLAMHEGGFKSTISVPNGANDNDNFWINSKGYLEHVKKFVICTDNDPKGIALREAIAQRLGRWRCTYIEFKNKDANGDLIAGCLDESISNEKRFPVSGTFTPRDIRNEIDKLYDEGFPATLYPKHECFGELKNVFSTMRGHLITVTGIPSSGKTTFVDWYVLNLVRDYEMKASWFSPEYGSLAEHQRAMIQVAIGKNFFVGGAFREKLSKQEKENWYNFSDERIYLTDTENGKFPTWDWMFEKWREQLFNFGIDIFVVDAFNKLGLNPKMDERRAMNEVITKLTLFAQMHNVLIFVVAHPTKMKKNEQGKTIVPTLYDVSGTSQFRDQTHDGFVIHRQYKTDNEPERTFFQNLKTKFQYQGEINGVVNFVYDKPSGRFYAEGQAVPSFDLTLPIEPEPEPEFEPIVDFSEPTKPNTDFDWTDSDAEMPF